MLKTAESPCIVLHKIQDRYTQNQNQDKISLQNSRNLVKTQELIFSYEHRQKKNNISDP